MDTTPRDVESIGVKIHGMLVIVIKNETASKTSFVGMNSVPKKDIVVSVHTHDMSKRVNNPFF
jgi:hypothetical protein